MQVLVAIIIYLYYHNELSNTKQKIFLEMQNYSLTLKSDKFGVDIVTKTANIKNFVLYEQEDLIAYFPISGVTDTVLKVILKAKKFQATVSKIQSRLTWYVVVSMAVLIILALLFSMYTLKPLRQSVYFLEEFLKDIIHDLNTPVTAILLNTKLLKKQYKEERVERIELSAKTIGSLHRNLESFLKDLPLQTGRVDMQSLLEERCHYFQSIYKDLDFKLDTQGVMITSSEDGLRRIIDNLLSNACKYNKANGFVHISLNEKGFSIEDSGVGIKNPSKVFERFYKEGDRGLGMGLNIVKKLCDALELSIDLQTSSEGTCFTISWSL